jgi:hypothetical protein
VRAAFAISALLLLSAILFLQFRIIEIAQATCSTISFAAKVERPICP